MAVDGAVPLLNPSWRREWSSEEGKESGSGSGGAYSVVMASCCIQFKTKDFT